jgi:hypothetical protein
MKKRVLFLLLISAVAAIEAGWPGNLSGATGAINDFTAIDRPAKIYPDYSSIVFPPNIAPLNFIVEEKGSDYLVKIQADKGEPIEISSKTGKIEITEAAWHKLIENNIGGEVRFEIFVKDEKQKWLKFGVITNKIAGENIDGYMVYRKSHPSLTLVKGPIGIFERNLANFDEKVVLDKRHYKAGCMNCHTFFENRPDKTLLGVRNVKYGPMTLFINGNNVTKIKAKFGYTTWHPSGKIAVYSLNNLPMVLHTANDEVRDTVDMDSTLAYYVFDSSEVKVTPEISRLDMLETWPAWSADGRYLYFCRAPMMWIDKNKVPPPNYTSVKYDLVRISYDVTNDKWGEVEPVVSARDTNMSVAMPRTSPDGRWLIFCMYDYGAFPPWQKNSDLYIIDLNSAGQSGKFEYKRMDISSDESEGWHSWSSNSRWIIFSSKRGQGAFTRSYISHIDEKGNGTKPFVVPQEDPEFYNHCLDTLNTPEFVTGPVLAAGEPLERAIKSKGIDVKMPMALTTATPSGKKRDSSLDLE